MKLFPLVLCLCLTAFSQDEPAEGGCGGRGGQEPIDARAFSILRTSQIGHAMISGRISQVAVFPDSPNHYLVAEASGNIFLTTNNGARWRMWR